MGLIGQGLKYANDKGILNNDVQLQNSLCFRGDEDVKIVDWGNTKPLTPENQMTDIKQFAGIIPKIFWHNDLVPTEVKKWINDVNNKKYDSHTDAWNSFTVAYKESWNSPDYKKNEKELKEYGPLMK